MKLSNFSSKIFIINNTPKTIIVQIIPILVFLAWSIFFFKGIASVPFHPDETTQIFMSSDFDKIVTGNVKELLFYEKDPDNPTQNYRLLDSPVTRYIIGLGRYLTQSPRLEVDWNWSGSWEENSSALPNRKLLNISRLSIAILLPVTILLYYLLIKKIFGLPLSALSTFLLMTNSIILLHTRRAMAESGLLFFLVISLIVLIKLPNKYLFLAAIPIVLGLNTKQSLLPLFIIGFVFIAYMSRSNKRSMVLQLSLYLLLIGSIFYILNPVMWEKPIAAFSEMLRKRSLLTSNQMNSIAIDTPTFILNNPIERFIGLFGQLFVVKPAFQDIANYESGLQNAIMEYNKNIFHSGFGRNIFIGAFIFVFFCIGVVSEFTLKNPKKILVFTVLFLFIIEILFFFPIPFQRYYIPLFPFSMIYVSSGIIRSSKYSINIVRNLKIIQPKE
jgi:hypothetical protein